MSRTAILLGASGILGSGFTTCLRSRPSTHLVAPTMPWGDPEGVAETLRRTLQGLPQAPTDVFWAAGTGRISASGDEMRTETRTVEMVVDLLEGPAGRGVATFFFASSAGALFGGHGSTVINSETPPSPVTAYGEEKLRQEAAVAGLSDSGACRTVVGRFSNVFGLANGWLRPKGLISVIIRSTLANQSASVFVNPDTRRDYVYAADAARMALALVDAQHDRCAVSIISQGSTLTVLDIIENVRRVTRRKVPVVFKETPETAVQPLMLAFERRKGLLATVPTSSFPAAIRVLTEGRLRQ